MQPANFESFSNAVDCYAGQMFISTWNDINFIRCCTRRGTIISTNIEKVCVKKNFLWLFGARKQLKFDKRYQLIFWCCFVIERVALFVFSSIWLFVGHNFLICIFRQYNHFLYLFSKIWRGRHLLLRSQDWLMKSK